ncbi:DUF6522 family protein [Loktanella sp. SALINAS62]|uniref:DUF6522 family protein n=1 Tax=Loktanella sp. SALINAS62 TaxID=2706124 RepID=UPI001B8C9577|nr:DUF6522 family protein [Loktanella sp. SALINAS62]MBS1303360.1 hypothetical protein [Loktanella sp. SALINAS62]
MNDVSISTDGFVVDAGIIGNAFGIPAADVPARMRAGDITSRCETGVDDDAGRWRLTFYFGGRALRLVVDEAGTILSRSTFPSHPPTTGPIDLSTLTDKS